MPLVNLFMILNTSLGLDRLGNGNIIPLENCNKKAYRDSLSCEPISFPSKSSTLYNFESSCFSTPIQLEARGNDATL